MTDANGLLRDAGGAILSLCDYTGNWSRPYEERGYHVIRVDLQHGQDVRLLEKVNAPIRGILAAPPCDAFAGSGARWWAGKGLLPLCEGLSIVDACLRAVVVHRPAWWALENPVGRLRKYLGAPTLIFHPCDFGDPYTKKTLLWGSFNEPARHPVEPIEGSKMHLVAPSPNRKNIRSATPMGFARAFAEANP